MNKENKFKFLVTGAAFGIGLLICTAASWLTYPFTTPNPNDTLLFATTNVPGSIGVWTNAQITVSNFAGYVATHLPTNTIYAATNTAPLGRVANPLAPNAFYTTPNAQGWIKLNCVCTNSALAWLTNATTGDVQLVGSILSSGTNYDSFYMRTGPGDVVCLTNKNGTIGLLNSEWRP